MIKQISTFVIGVVLTVIWSSSPIGALPPAGGPKALPKPKTSKAPSSAVDKTTKTATTQGTQSAPVKPKTPTATGQSTSSSSSSSSSSGSGATLRVLPVDIMSSKARYLRRLQDGEGRNPRSKRNFMQEKWVKRNSDGSREVRYLVSESMGIGVRKFTLANESVLTKRGAPKKRSHTEPQHMAVEQQGKLKLTDGSTLDMTGFRRKYATSTNSMCKQGVRGQEGCEAFTPEFVKQGGRFYYVNSYSGGGTAGGFQARLRRARKHGESSADSSESSSSESVQVHMIDHPKLRGHAFKPGDAVPARTVGLKRRTSSKKDAGSDKTGSTTSSSSSSTGTGKSDVSETPGAAKKKQKTTGKSGKKLKINDPSG